MKFCQIANMLVTNSFRYGTKFLVTNNVDFLTLFIGDGDDTIEKLGDSG